MKKDRQNQSKNQARSGEVLNDGKRDWRKYKLQSLAISSAYHFFDDLKKYAYQINDCGSWLQFSACPQGHERRLLKAFFCRCRLCVICQWRKSLVMYHQIFKLIHAHREQYKSDVPLLLTLTVPNVRADQLPDCLNNMQDAFKKLMMRRNVKRSVRSSFRSLEVTYSNKRNDYHPHYHVLLLVPKNYFDSRHSLYIERDEWLTMWREATGQSEITQVDIRRVRKARKGEIEGVSAEVGKYATKPADYCVKQPDGSYKSDQKVVNVLHWALKGRRLVAFGGLFVKLRKQLEQDDIEHSDLVNITDEIKACQCSVCQSTLIIELYKWHLQNRGFLKQELVKNTD